MDKGLNHFQQIDLHGHHLSSKVQESFPDMFLSIPL